MPAPPPLIHSALLIVLGIVVWAPLQLTPHWDLEKVHFWPQIAFAFGGLELGAIMGGEIRNPVRNVPRGLDLGRFHRGVLYSRHAVTDGVDAARTHQYPHRFGAGFE